MPPANRQWDRGRKPPARRPLRRILILCEDTKSSRDYLDQFPRDRRQVQIECIGTGMNTASLMEEALDRKRRAEYAHAPYEAIWVVFDKDDFSLQSFNRAFDLARPHPAVRVCWANECFELWYLLHFELRQTSTARRAIWAKLAEHLQGPYNRACPSGRRGPWVLRRCAKEKRA
ncbi:MAG: RloB domain-containing protein [Verrucomicrobiales bacterium]|nr:RloB domain-containing protein [Verrucomicrobiales bacterium]